MRFRYSLPMRFGSGKLEGMGKGRISAEELARRKAQSEKTQTANMDQAGPILDRTKQDTGTFMTILGVVLVPLVFVLQANGVVHVGWVASIFIYISVLGLFIVFFLKWRNPW